jgi:hypothetical protein
MIKIEYFYRDYNSGFETLPSIVIIRIFGIVVFSKSYKRPGENNLV